MFALVALAGCRRDAGTMADEADTDIEVEEDGYRKDSTDLDAPKAIESTEITSFACYFSAAPYEETDTELEYDFYRFSATLNENRVSGNYRATSRYQDQVQEEFETDAAFMEALQKIVSKHNLAENNGHYVEVKGLPDMYGAELEVAYASGESISAYDNEGSFLSIAAMEAIEELFRGQLEGTEGKESHGPKLLDITMEEKRLTENVDGCFLEVTYPEFTLGYPYWDGTMRGVEGYEALQEALNDYNTTVRMEQESKLNNTLRSAAGQLTANGEEPRELYSYTDAYVTRSDEQVLSFYEHITWYEWWLEEQYFWGAYNYDVATGNLLGYEDIFTDRDILPLLLTEAFQEAYPELEFSDMMIDLIEEAVREETTSISFALGHDCIHFFAADYWLAHHRGGLHITLPYSEYPNLVKQEYQTASEDWLLELEYDTTYALENLGDLRMSWSRPYEDREDIEWTVSVNGNTYSESLYGYPPDCYLACVSGKYFLRLEVPTGDVSQLTNMYEVTKGGAVFLEQAGIGMHGKAGANPRRMLMYENDMIFAAYVFLMPYGLYGISEDGSLESAAEGESGIENTPLVLLQDIRVREVDLEDGEKVIGLTDVSEGTVMTPLRTDKETYMDFLCEDGRVCRFEISDFSDEMNLDGFGTLPELFMLEAHLEYGM